MAQIGGNLDAARERTALIDEWHSYSAGELLDRSTAVAQAISGRRRIMMMSGNCAESVILWLATMAAGGLWASANPRYGAAEQLALVRRFAPDLLVVDDGVDPMVTEASGAEVIGLCPGGGLSELGGALTAAGFPDVDPDAPAAVGFTSGTSGRPRGVLHSQAGLLLAAQAHLLLDKPAGPIGVMLSTMVLNVMVLGPLQGLLANRTVVLANRTDGDYLARWFAEHRIAEIGVPPTIIHDLLDQFDRVGDDRMIPARVETGGAACSSELQRRFHAATGRHIVRAYGLTEGPATVAMCDPSRPALPDCSGVAMPHVRLTIGTDGEICVSAALDGPLAGRYRPMLGYLDDDSPVPVRHGVLHTGDLGRLDSEGRLFVTGRKSARIIRGGANISPAEVEEVLVSHPAVDDAVVFGVPDERLGEVVAAAITPADGESLDVEDLRSHTAASLARYKVPRFIIVLLEIPRNPGGKPDRDALLAAWREHGRT